MRRVSNRTGGQSDRYGTQCFRGYVCQGWQGRKQPVDGRWTVVQPPHPGSSWTMALCRRQGRGRSARVSPSGRSCTRSPRSPRSPGRGGHSSSRTSRTCSPLRYPGQPLQCGRCGSEPRWLNVPRGSPTSGARGTIHHHPCGPCPRHLPGGRTPTPQGAPAADRPTSWAAW